MLSSKDRDKHSTAFYRTHQEPSNQEAALRSHDPDEEVIKKSDEDLDPTHFWTKNIHKQNQD